MKLKADLHVHSSYSKDSFLKPDKIVEVCLQKAINCLAICDHNEIKGAFEIKRLAPFKIIIAEEIKTNEGEIIGYFLNKKIQPNLSPEETIKQIKKQGGLVALPHPFDNLRRSIIKRDALNRIIKEVDMIEVFNAGNVFKKSDEKAMELCKSLNKAPYSGSDAHSTQALGYGIFEIEDFDSPQEFLKNLKEAKFYNKKSPIWTHFIIIFCKFLKLFKRNH